MSYHISVATRATNSNKLRRPEVVYNRERVHSWKCAYFSELGTACVTLLSPRCPPPCSNPANTITHPPLHHLFTNTARPQPPHSSPLNFLLTTLSSAVRREVWGMGATLCHGFISNAFGCFIITVLINNQQTTTGINERMEPLSRYGLI